MKLYGKYPINWTQIVSFLLNYYASEFMCQVPKQAKVGLSFHHMKEFLLPPLYT